MRTSKLHFARIGLFIIFCLVLCSCSGRSRLKPGEVPPPVLPTTDEKASAESFISQYVNQEGYTPVTSGPEVKRVTNVVQRLAKAAGFAPNTFPIHFVDAGDDVNAMAVNSASIVVYKKLLERVKSDDELAVVLSHEIGHVLGRHSQEEEQKKSRATAVSIGSTILGTVASVATSVAGFGGLSDVAGSVTETTTGMVGYGAFVGSFDRDQEYEADQIGLLLMARAGYKPQTALEFWSRAEEIFGDSTSKVGAFFSTHPSFGDRESALRAAMPYAEEEYKRVKSAKAR